jgi:hypothetical protein
MGTQSKAEAGPTVAARTQHITIRDMMKIFERRGIDETIVERKSVDQRKFN